MPRKILVTALALMGVLAVAGVAYAVNVYKLDKASTTPGGTGTSSQPVAKQVVFSFSTNTNDGKRAKVIRFYDIGFQGLRSYSTTVKRCDFAQANQKDLVQVKHDCAKAFAGEGKINNFFGPTNNENAKTPCNLKLRIYNVKGSYLEDGKQHKFGKYGGLALRIDRAKQADCIVDPSTAIPAPFRKTKIGGKEAVNLKFQVGTNLRHPLPGFDNSVNIVASTVKKLTAKVKINGQRRTVGLLSSVACGKQNKRSITVKFTDETGISATVKKSTKC